MLTCLVIIPYQIRRPFTKKSSEYTIVFFKYIHKNIYMYCVNFSFLVYMPDNILIKNKGRHVQEFSSNINLKKRYKIYTRYVSRP